MLCMSHNKDVYYNFYCELTTCGEGEEREGGIEEARGEGGREGKGGVTGEA